MDYYSTTKDPQEAFKIAKSIVKDCSTEEKLITLFGRPFLRSEIDWEKKYAQHLAGPSAQVSFSPTSGVDKCLCSTCFYRDAPKKSNPTRDCQVGENGDLAKKFFGFSRNEFLPETIDGEEVGHYCPYWLTFMAE